MHSGWISVKFKNMNEILFEEVLNFDIGAISR